MQLLAVKAGTIKLNCVFHCERPLGSLANTARIISVSKRRPSSNACETLSICSPIVGLECRSESDNNERMVVWTACTPAPATCSRFAIGHQGMTRRDELNCDTRLVLALLEHDRQQRCSSQYDPLILRVGLNLPALPARAFSLTPKRRQLFVVPSVN